MPQVKRAGARVLGIDPGLATTGFGIIEESANGYHIVEAGAIITGARESFGGRLDTIYRDTVALLEKFRPTKVGIEQLFFAKNVTTAFSVGQARGVIVLACHQAKVPIHEYTPLQVKQSITGYGQANKTQMQKMIQMLFKLKNPPCPDDVADALAVAVCCSQTKHFHAKK